MAKKHSKLNAKPPKQLVTDEHILVPDYLRKFHCIGSNCEDTCCIGWGVDIDQATWRRYQASQHKTLSPLFERVVVRQTNPNAYDDQAYAIINMLPNGWCPFLQQDKLCLIQKELGDEALSFTCTKYPRYYNLFGEQLECGLNVSCPEAARLVLLHPEPITLVRDAPDTYHFMRENKNFRVLITPENVTPLKEF